MTEKINPGDIYNKIQYAQDIFKHGLIYAITAAIISIILYFILASTIQLLANFILMLGCVFGSISGIQHYRGYMIVKRIKRKGIITQKDMEDIYKLKWG